MVDIDYTKQSPSIKQAKMIRFIEVNLAIPFKGKSAQDAYEFIGKYHKQADEYYKNGGGKEYHQDKAQRAIAYYEEMSEWLDSIGAHPSDYGVPNH